MGKMYVLLILTLMGAAAYNALNIVYGMGVLQGKNSVVCPQNTAAPKWVGKICRMEDGFTYEADTCGSDKEVK